MRPTRTARALLALLLLLAAVGCTRDAVDWPTPSDGAVDVPAADTGPVDLHAPDLSAPSADVPPADTSDVAPATTLPSFVVGTWNLHNFSIYGEDEWRLADIATHIGDELAPDLLAVQELKVRDGTDGAPPQAWDALLELLPDYAGVHAPWDTFDSAVGLLYRPERVTLDATEILFEDDSWAFPRSPLAATVTVSDPAAEADVTLTVVVLHLKAMGDSADRRLLACGKLDGWVDAHPERAVVLIGDWNDDPYDPPGENVFAGTFLDAPDDYVFVTTVFPPESVTSTGWYHFVDGQRVEGEFLDHAVVTTGLHRRFASVTTTIVGVPEAAFSDYRERLSDHFPVLVDFVAP